LTDLAEKVAMPKGRYQVEYFSNPRIHQTKSLTEIYADIDGYSMEYFEDEPDFYDRIDFVVVLPPLGYGGQFVKGIFFSQGVDYLYRLYPQLNKIFHSIGNAQWGAIPWSRHADGLFSLYENEHREKWFRQTYPERATKVLVPLQDADHTHEYAMAQVPFQKREIDVLCVSRLHDLKNIPLIAEALKIYRQKYHPLRMVLILGKDVGLNLSGFTEGEREQWRKIESVLTHPFDFVEIVPKANHAKELPRFYSRSKLCVLGSLFEGKNRSLHEAMCCNTPVVCFQELNQYIRGITSPFPTGAGLAAPHFTAEALADTFHEVLQNHGDFHPRRRYLEVSGRKNFFNRTLDCFSSYYESLVPEFCRGHHVTNLWLDLAVQYNYELSLQDFVYDKNYLLSHVRGATAIKKLLDFYFGRFGVGSKALERSCN
jgi:glycosyltransferase involved in cell wall biosynthesis